MTGYVGEGLKRVKILSSEIGNSYFWTIRQQLSDLYRSNAYNVDTVDQTNGSKINVSNFFLQEEGTLKEKKLPNAFKDVSILCIILKIIGSTLR